VKRGRSCSDASDIPSTSTAVARPQRPQLQQQQQQQAAQTAATSAIAETAERVRAAVASAVSAGKTGAATSGATSVPRFTGTPVAASAVPPLQVRTASHWFMLDLFTDFLQYLLQYECCML
jgi:fatty acid/phospholipid biosynthesis enzyme